MSRNLAEGMDKLPAAEGEGGVINQNLLTAGELRKLIDAAIDPWAMPIMLAAFARCDSTICADSFSSNLLATGLDVVTGSKALGHANVHITLVTYAHAIPKQRHGAGDGLARLLAQSGNKMETSVAETGSAA